MGENERLAKVEVQVEQIYKDVEDIKENNKVIHNIATSIQVMAEQMTTVKSDVADMKSRMNKAEAAENGKHKKLFDSVKDKLVWVFVGGLALYVFDVIFPFTK